MFFTVSASENGSRIQLEVSAPDKPSALERVRQQRPQAQVHHLYYCPQAAGVHRYILVGDYADKGVVFCHQQLHFRPQMVYGLYYVLFGNPRNVIGLPPDQGLVLSGGGELINGAGSLIDIAYWHRAQHRPGGARTARPTVARQCA